MEICCKCEIFIKNSRFWNKKEAKMRKNFKILDKNRSFQKKRQEIEKYNRMQKCLMSKKRICGKI